MTDSSGLVSVKHLAGYFKNGTVLLLLRIVSYYSTAFKGNNLAPFTATIYKKL